VSEEPRMVEPGKERRGARAPGVHWRGHALRFEPRSAPGYEAPAGMRLLLVFLVLEGVLGPRLSLLTWLRLPVPPVWVRVPVLLAVALLSVRFIARLKLAQIGLHPWRRWNATEKSYFIQLLVIANFVFAVLFADRLRAILTGPSLLSRVGTVLVPYFLWGFYQEVMYRGILQTELVRRWGPLRGILVSNCLFTFGPLHFYHFAHTSPPAPVFAGIFAIGLFFALVFWRSGNLWLVAVSHGIGNTYIDGTQQL
jgi:membrane protease YdiL (CAAX protease family)